MCLPGLIRSSHELMPINQTVNEVVTVLASLNSQVIEMQQQKKYKLEQYFDLKKLIEADSQAF